MTDFLTGTHLAILFVSIGILSFLVVYELLRLFRRQSKRKTTYKADTPLGILEQRKAWEGITPAERFPGAGTSRRYDQVERDRKRRRKS